MVSDRVTRGYGLLEQYLARRRALRADVLIPDAVREGRILDIGCGQSPLFLSTTRFHEKYGVDKQFFLQQERGSESGLTLRRVDLDQLSELPFPENFFEVVTMLAVIEHLPAASGKRLIREVYRVLKKGGLLVMTTPTPWTARLIRILGRVGVISPVEAQDHKGYYSLDLMRRLMQEKGFDPERIRQGYFELCMNSWTLARK